MMVEFQLTEEQLEALKPLQKKVRKAYMADKRGMIIAQLDGHQRGECRAMFVPEKVSEEIRAILLAYKKRYRKEKV